MSTEDKVSTPHTEYTPQQLKRDVFAAVKDTDTIRAAGTSHLFRYPGEESSEYDARLRSSTIDGITYGGVDTLLGAVFYEEIDTEAVHSSIQPLLENIDNQGNHFNVFARDAFRASFDGFSVIVVDMPVPVTDVKSLEDAKVNGMRPYWRLYKAKDVINWRFRINPVSKQKELSLIVFEEKTEEPAGRFISTCVTRYRVWFLDDSGNAMWEVWIKTDKEREDARPVLESSGSFNAKELAVAFIGDVCDDPKLLVESRLEIKAYQKESSFDTIEYLSIPTFYTKGYPEDGPKLSLGASSHIKLPADPDAECGYIQIDAAGHAELKATFQQVKSEIKGRVNLMVQSAVESGNGGNSGDGKTATQVNSEDSSRQARLVVWADELHDALERALQFTGIAMGLGPDQAGTITLRTKWAVSAEKAQEQAQRDAETHAATIASEKAKAIGH
jgi:hypothetical protein